MENCWLWFGLLWLAIFWSLLHAFLCLFYFIFLPCAFCHISLVFFVCVLIHCVLNFSIHYFLIGSLSFFLCFFFLCHLFIFSSRLNLLLTSWFDAPTCPHLFICFLIFYSYFDLYSISLLVASIPLSSVKFSCLWPCHSLSESLLWRLTFQFKSVLCSDINQTMSRS